MGRACFNSSWGYNVLPPTTWRCATSALREALQAEEDAMQTRETVSHEVVANVLVGAEEAEAKLEALLQRKRELLGEA